MTSVAPEQVKPDRTHITHGFRGLRSDAAKVCDEPCEHPGTPASFGAAVGDISAVIRAQVQDLMNQQEV
jgi:hypothetical protein